MHSNGKFPIMFQPIPDDSMKTDFWFKSYKNHENLDFLCLGIEIFIKDLYWKYRKLIFQRKVSQICKFAAQILKEHKKSVLGRFLDSPRTQQDLRLKFAFAIFVLVTLYSSRDSKNRAPARKRARDFCLSRGSSRAWSSRAEPSLVSGSSVFFYHAYTMHRGYQVTMHMTCKVIYQLTMHVPCIPGMHGCMVLKFSCVHLLIKSYRNFQKFREPFSKFSKIIKIINHATVHSRFFAW